MADVGWDTGAQDSGIEYVIVAAWLAGWMVGCLTAAPAVSEGAGGGG